MPSPRPAPRRASSAGRPAPRSGPRTGAASGRDARTGGSKSNYRARPAREGAERRIERKDDGRSERPTGFGRERDDRGSRRTESQRGARNEQDARRPRPSASARGAKSTPRPRDRDARTVPRDGAPSRGTRDDSRYQRPEARERREGERTERHSDFRRGPDRGGAKGPVRPARGGTGRSERGEESFDARTGPRRRGPAPAPAGRRPAGARPHTRTARGPTPEEIDRQKIESHSRAKGWGGVARKGAANIKSSGQAMAVTPSAGRTPDPLEPWVQEERATKGVVPAKARAKVKYALPGDVASDVRKAFIGTAYAREKAVMTLTRAAEAYDRKRYEEALRLGRTVADVVPGVAPVRELTGLAAYRAERWSMAKIHLRAHFAITGDPEHLPLVMDCERAGHRYRAVEKTFGELEASEPTAEVLVEGRIVMAGAWADQQRYEDAIELLTKAGATKQLRNPSYRHVRLWYALGDVFDRAGDAGSARELFARVVIAEPDAYDAQARLAELGASAPRKNRKRRTTPVSKKKFD